jgi:hypothetical protein
MRMTVERTVSVVKPKEDHRFGQEKSSLSDFDSNHGYVLLGEPGMGKSTCFTEEANRIGAEDPISARHFIRHNPEHHPEWQEGPLFIDGLDEVRIGGGDPIAALDKIITHLEASGKPRFRLSCRAGSWLGDRDLRELSSLTGSEVIPVLELNPLNHDNVRQITSPNIEDANGFILQAYEHGMEAFLFNPQLLDLLLTSVENGGWPDNPSETFENACRELVREQNPKSRDARSFDAQLPSLQAVLSAAGQLSALMLFANKTAWSVDNTDDPEVLSLRDVDCQERSALRGAFDSSLFRGNLSCRTPIHRLLVEFLGAKYLAEKIQNGLMIQRVFALLMGHDGIPLPDLRGLTGWLAALAPETRKPLIQADPIAIAFNGDASSFRPEERKALLEGLEQNIHLQYSRPTAACLGALAGGQGRLAVWELSNSSIRSENRQTLVYWLLCGVSQTYSDMAKNCNSIVDVKVELDRNNLLKIVYDPSWAIDIRRQALRTLDMVLIDKPDHSATMRELIKDLEENRLPDQENDLMGTILDLSYPSALKPTEIWNLLLTGPKEPGNVYKLFFTNLADKSTKEQIKELLDSLCDRASAIIPKLASHRIADTVLILLARGLDLFGDRLDLSELYRWFKLVKFDHSSYELIPVHDSTHAYGGYNNAKASAAILNWLGERRKIQYQLIERELTELESKIGDRLLNKITGLKFMGENTPVGFRSWCLTRAEELWDSRPKIAKELASWSIREEAGWELPLSDEEVARAVSGAASLMKWNADRLKSRIQFELKEAELRKEQEEIEATFRKRKQEELEYIRRQQTELAGGCCEPGLLDELARIYFYGRVTNDGSPQTYLESYLDDDQCLVQTALSGFRSLLDRNDLPDLDEIARLHENSKRSYFARPFLAGMEEEDEDVLSRLSEKGRRRALGFYFVTELPRQHIAFPNTNADLPPWYQHALTCYPETVADSLVAIHIACVRAKFPPNEHLLKVALDPAYVSVTRLAVSRMFTVFPTRCNALQLESLRVVLWSTLLADVTSAEELQKITLKRLQRQNLDVGQRALWLCTGLFVARDHCLPRLIDFLSGGDESRLHHVLGFLVRDGQGQSMLQNLGEWRAEDISRLIQELGKRVQLPKYRKRAGHINAEQIASRRLLTLMTTWLQELARRSDDDAANVFDLLASDSNLAAWGREMSKWQEVQARLRRADRRQDLGLTLIQETLRNGPPSNAADLAGITVHVLRKLGNRIRNTETNDWRQYWHIDPESRKPENPKHENDCRDALLSDLKEMLRQYQIDAQPEGQYADDKRADIRVSYGTQFSIPIEIKKNSHPKIWHGITEQLVPKYTRDPIADGYGIYLVLWFGTDHTHMGRTSRSYDIPGNPEELRSLLEQQLDPPLRKKINVVVIDVSASDYHTREL